MERTVKELLDDYRDADFNKRLDLYLQCRELRSEFMEIEKDGLRHESLCARGRLTEFPKMLAGSLLSQAGWRMKRILGYIST